MNEAASAYPPISSESTLTANVALAPGNTHSPALQSWRARVFASTWLSYTGLYFARKPFSIVKSDLGKALSFDAQDLSVIYASYLIAYTLGQFVSGALGPRFGARAMLLAGMGVSVVTAAAFGFAAQMPWFVALMIINGFAQATGWSNNVGCMAAWFHRGERGTVMGWWATCFQVGNVIAPAFAAWTLAHYGFRYAFFTGAMALAAVWVFFFFNQANRPEDRGLPPVTAPGVADSGAPHPATTVRWSGSTWITVFLVGGAYFGMKFIRYAIDSWAPFFLARNFDLKGDDAGYLSTLFGVCGIAGVILTGWWSDRFFRGRRAKISFFMIIGVAVATIFMATAGTHSAVSFTIAISLIGFTLYGPDALMTGAGAMDIGSEVGAVRAAGIISGLGSAGSVVQELLIGHMYKQSGGAMGPVLATLFGSALLSAACLGAILWRNQRGASDV